MKAIVYHEYGSADVLKCEDVEKPVPKDDEVLIKVRAASVNPLDWRLMKGKPRALRKCRGCSKCRSDDRALMLPARLKQLAKTLRSSNRATKCSADAVERLRSTRPRARKVSSRNPTASRSSKPLRYTSQG